MAGDLYTHIMHRSNTNTKSSLNDWTCEETVKCDICQEIRQTGAGQEVIQMLEWR